VHADGLCYGRHDVSAALGDEEAVAAILDAIPATAFNRVWSSPASRCLGPARAVARKLHLRVSIDERLAELDFGTWEGRTWAEIEASDAPTLRAWMSAWQTAAPPGGETVASLEHRVRQWVTSLERQSGHLLVGHAGVIRALRVIAERCDWAGAMRSEVAWLTAEHFEVP
jgi:alpha-ribazole phosphatase